MNNVEKNIDALWSEDFEKFIVAASATGDDDPCGGSSGGNSSASSSCSGGAGSTGGSGPGSSGMSNTSQRSSASISRGANIQNDILLGCVPNLQKAYQQPRVYPQQRYNR